MKMLGELDTTRIALYDSNGKKIGVFKPTSIDIDSYDYLDWRGDIVKTEVKSKEFRVDIDLNGSVYDEAYSFNCPCCNAKSDHDKLNVITVIHILIGVCLSYMRIRIKL